MIAQLAEVAMCQKTRLPRHVGYQGLSVRSTSNVAYFNESQGDWDTMAKLDIDAAPHQAGSTCLEPYDAELDARRSLRAGDAGRLAQFAANILIRTDTEALFLVTGMRTPSVTGWYSNVDLKATMDAGGFAFSREDGTPY